jgi:hypothetical protein
MASIDRKWNVSVSMPSVATSEDGGAALSQSSNWAPRKLPVKAEAHPTKANASWGSDQELARAAKHRNSAKEKKAM